MTYEATGLATYRGNVLSILGPGGRTMVATPQSIVGAALRDIKSPVDHNAIHMYVATVEESVAQHTVTITPESSETDTITGTLVDGNHRVPFLYVEAVLVDATYGCYRLLVFGKRADSGQLASLNIPLWDDGDLKIGRITTSLYRQLLFGPGQTVRVVRPRETEPLDYAVRLSGDGERLTPRSAPATPALSDPPGDNAPRSAEAEWKPAGST